MFASRRDGASTEKIACLLTLETIVLLGLDYFFVRFLPLFNISRQPTFTSAGRKPKR